MITELSLLSLPHRPQPSLRVKDLSSFLVTPSRPCEELNYITMNRSSASSASATEERTSPNVNPFATPMQETPANPFATPSASFARLPYTGSASSDSGNCKDIFAFDILLCNMLLTNGVQSMRSGDGSRAVALRASSRSHGSRQRSEAWTGIESSSTPASRLV